MRNIPSIDVSDGGVLLTMQILEDVLTRVEKDVKDAAKVLILCDEAKKTRAAVAIAMLGMIFLANNEDIANDDLPADGGKLADLFRVMAESTSYGEPEGSDGSDGVE